jgi:hypothetical protein
MIFIKAPVRVSCFNSKEYTPVYVPGYHFWHKNIALAVHKAVVWDNIDDTWVVLKSRWTVTEITTGSKVQHYFMSSRREAVAAAIERLETKTKQEIDDAIQRSLERISRVDKEKARVDL